MRTVPFGRATSHTPCSSASKAKEKAFAFSSATVHPRTFSPPVTAPSAASAPSPKTPAHYPSAHAHTSVRTFQFLVTFIMCSSHRCRSRIDLFHSVYKAIICTPPVNCEF